MVWYSMRSGNAPPVGQAPAALELTVLLDTVRPKANSSRQLNFRVHRYHYLSSWHKINEERQTLCNPKVIGGKILNNYRFLTQLSGLL